MNRTMSVYLDLVRPLAALTVLLSHASDGPLSGGQWKAWSNTGVLAVDVFFVLSGFVIAHVTATREADAYSYFMNRTARIYSVAIPAIILTAILDQIGSRADPAIYGSAYQPLSGGLLLRSVLFLGEQWNTHRFPGTDGPYWSLGFEVWYYAAFGLVAFARARWRWAAAAAALSFVGPKVAILFPVWLMGVAAYHAAASRWLTERPGFGAVLLGVPAAGLIAYAFVHPSLPQPFTPVTLAPARLAAVAQDYLVGGLFALHLLGVAAVSATRGRWLRGYAAPIRWLSGATFSIYLVHLPIMCFLASMSPWDKSSRLHFVFMVAGGVGFSMLFARVFERRKLAWQRAIDACVQIGQRRPMAGPAPAGEAE